MKLIDTHAHLQFQAYDDDRDKVIERNSKRLDAIINVGAKIDSSERGVALAQKVENFYSAVGVHPHHVDEWQESWIEKLEELASKPKVVAIGEVGLDNHEYVGYPKPNLKKQEKMLTSQINLANKLNLPILFHCRKAYDELFRILKVYNNLKGLVHCYMGTDKQVKNFLSLGLYISFSGNLTYKSNSFIRESAKQAPLEQLLVETDAPYLPPEPHRGQRNEPYFIIKTAEVLAEVKSKSYDEICKATNDNSRRLFRL